LQLKLVTQSRLWLKSFSTFRNKNCLQKWK
jgi:hypothetical protein